MNKRHVREKINFFGEFLHSFGNLCSCCNWNDSGLCNIKNFHVQVKAHA